MSKISSRTSSSFEQSLTGLRADDCPGTDGLSLDDLSALRQELARYQRLEQGWRRALEASNLGAWSLDVANGEFFYCNTWRRVRGIEEDEDLDVALDSWIKVVHPDDREHVLAAIEAQNSGSQAFSITEYRERHRDGRWIWIESRSSILEWDPSGRASRVVGTDADITHRKAAEQATDLLTRKLTLAMEVAEIGIFEADLESGQVRRDARLLEMYGVEPGTPQIDVHGTFQRERLHPDDRDACMRRIDEGTASGVPFENEFRILTQRGEVRHLRSRSVAYFDYEGRRKLLGVNWDVTKDMSLQEKLRRAAADAEARSEAIEAARETIRQLAVHDELTGLLNRRGLNEYMALWAEGERRFSAVVHVDLDNFKIVNDTMGHEAGDRVLQATAERMQGLAGAEDILARWGGDEFVLLVGEKRSRDDVASIAQCLVSSLQKPVVIEGIPAPAGASVGVAWACAGVAPERILAEADAALYRAKQGGRARAEFSQAARTAEPSLSAVDEP